MSEWIETTLGAISTQRKGINYKSEDYCPDDTGHPFITIKCFQKGGGYEPTGIKFYDGESTKADHLDNGDILFSVTDLTRAGDIVGSPLRVPTFGNSAPALASMDCMRITPLEGKSSKSFLYHRLMLSVVRRQMVAYAAGSTVLHLDTKNVPFIRVRIPASVSTQKKIATILSTIDTSIEQTEALIEKYQHIKAGLMHDLFTRGVLPNGQLRPSREQAPELYQETAIGWIPREWSLHRLDAIADVIDPNPSHRNPIYHPAGFPFISTVEFIDNDEVEIDTSRRVIEEIVEEQERRCHFSPKSIGFSRKGTIGEIRFLPTGIRFALLDSLCVINPKTISASYLFHSLRSECLTRQSKNMTMGQALPQVSIGRVRDLLVPLPDSDEQTHIEGRLDAVMSAIKNQVLHRFHCEFSLAKPQVRTPAKSTFPN